MRILTVLLAILCVIIIVRMTIAPKQEDVRNAYLTTLCPGLDLISTDICAAVRRGGGEKAI